jgi:mRNA interferase RelE/StbE
VAKYKVLIKPSAVKEIEKISRKADRQRIVEQIAALANDPRPLGSQKLAGRERFRLRQGPYRIIFSIQDDELLVIVVKVGHRKDVYRGNY